MEATDSFSMFEIWMAIGLTLLAIEMVILTGATLLAAIAFLATAMITKLFGVGIVVQLLFLSSALIASFFVGKCFYKKLFPKSKAVVNDRDAELIGRSYHLHTAIVDGAGEIKIGDSLYSVYGADAIAGTAVRVTAKKGMGFEVESVVDE